MKSFPRKVGQTLKEGFHSPARVVGVLLLVAVIFFGWNGLASWRAIGHVQKACDLIIPIGKELKPNVVYGSGAISATYEEGAKLDIAYKESIVAAIADLRHFGHFDAAVGSLDLNLNTNKAPLAPEDQAWPYGLYNNVILPACIKTMQLNFLEKLNIWRH